VDGLPVPNCGAGTRGRERGDGASLGTSARATLGRIAALCGRGFHRRARAARGRHVSRQGVDAASRIARGAPGPFALTISATVIGEGAWSQCARCVPLGSPARHGALCLDRQAADRLGVCERPSPVAGLSALGRAPLVPACAHPAASLAGHCAKVVFCEAHAGSDAGAALARDGSPA